MDRNLLLLLTRFKRRNVFEKFSTFNIFFKDKNNQHAPANFEYGTDTTPHKSCSLTFQNKAYVFGGYQNGKQISRLDGCSLEKIGELSFEEG